VKKITLFLSMFTIILSACTSQTDSLLGTWELTSYGPTESMISAVPDADATLTFAENGTVSGSSGCNSLSGEYTVEGSQITFSALTTTLMACEEPRMDQESAVLQVLSDTVEFEIENETLTITNGNMVLVFSSVPAE
jgi:heat shock protein HslJ